MGNRLNTRGLSRRSQAQGLCSDGVHWGVPWFGTDDIWAVTKL